jgi:hypothetical protein
MIAEAVNRHGSARLKWRISRLAVLDDQTTNQGGLRDIKSKDLACVMRIEVTFLSSFTFWCQERWA